LDRLYPLKIAHWKDIYLLSQHLASLAGAAAPLERAWRYREFIHAAARRDFVCGFRDAASKPLPVVVPSPILIFTTAIFYMLASMPLAVAIAARFNIVGDYTGMRRLTAREGHSPNPFAPNPFGNVALVAVFRAVAGYLLFARRPVVVDVI
jgi:hypothetical protein